MPAGSSGWFWHCLARETGCLGHLYSPTDQRGPWPWFPYALDNGSFNCWNQSENTFDYDKWEKNEVEWKKLLFWSQCNNQKAKWAIVPDVPGNAEQTLDRWNIYSPTVLKAQIPLAIAVQDGMDVKDVKGLSPVPSVICVGGTTEFKWSTIEMWAEGFPRVHVLRCNSPEKLEYLQCLPTVESCDGTGWNRGSRDQTLGLEKFCSKHKKSNLTHAWMTPFVSRKINKKQITFS